MPVKVNLSSLMIERRLNELVNGSSAKSRAASSDVKSHPPSPFVAKQVTTVFFCFTLFGLNYGGSQGDFPNAMT